MTKKITIALKRYCHILHVHTLLMLSQLLAPLQPVLKSVVSANWGSIGVTPLILWQCSGLVIGYYTQTISQGSRSHTYPIPVSAGYSCQFWRSNGGAMLQCMGLGVLFAKKEDSSDRFWYMRLLNRGECKGCITKEARIQVRVLYSDNICLSWISDLIWRKMASVLCTRLYAFV